MLVGLIYLISVCTLLVWAIRIIHQRELQQQLEQAEYEARYHRQEAEITLGVSQRILSSYAARVAAVYGQDYQDYLIARQLRLSEQLPQEQERPPFQVVYGGRGQTIPARENTPQREWERGDYESPACWRTPEPPPSHTPPQQWQARPQVPRMGFRQPAAYLRHQDWQDEWDGGGVWPYGGDDIDDDVLDVQTLPVYPPALLPQPPQLPQSIPAGGGRQRKYASDAERQRAYRERRKQRGRY